MLVENSRMIYRGSEGLARAYQGDHVIVWEPGEPLPHEDEYLTFTVKGADPGAYFCFDHASTGGQIPHLDIYFMKNPDSPGAQWIKYDDSTSTDRAVASGDTIIVKGNNQQYSVYLTGDTTSCIGVHNGYYDISGNIMSLVYGDSFFRHTGLHGDNNFAGLFARHSGDGYYNNGFCLSSEDLVLPSYAMTENCYAAMFSGQTQMTEGPELRATVLSSGCYMYMFSNAGLTYPVALSATTLADHCYAWMFFNTPIYMGTELPATTLAPYCYEGMFNCTSIQGSPVLPAETLAEGCYRYMFGLCQDLDDITCLATDISAFQCTYHWVDGVGSYGDFYKNPNMSGWATGINDVPSGWTVHDYSPSGNDIPVDL